MNRESFKIFELTNEREAALWKDAIFVFDTSALLDFYFYPVETRTQIFDQIFNALDKRLWIPSHVEFEYLKNRKAQILKPISEKYNGLKNGKLKDLNTSRIKLLKVIDTLGKETTKADSHPFLPQEGIKQFQQKANSFSDEMDAFIEHINAEIVKQENEILSLQNDDKILEAIEKHIEAGEPTTFTGILSIAQEGEFRYKHKIPPGYLDQKDKEGTQVFGDLIIWKQILEFAAKRNSNVIFICNDLKLDWCYTESRNRIRSPREELIKEFFDSVGKEFWMYNQSQFLYKANEQLKTDLAPSKIEQISKVIDDRNKTHLGFKCNKCGMENMVDFEITPPHIISHRNFTRNGIKSLFIQAIQELDCQYCKHDIIMMYTFELKDGNQVVYSKLSCDEAEIISTPNFIKSFLDGNFDIPDMDDFDFDTHRNR